MNVSIVIPVYNEGQHLAAALEAIARQTVAPYEVIVVDNNSSDGTAAIAESFPFVRLLREPRQGVVHARNRGFDAATGDIIGRIDADTLLPADWVAQLRAIFQESSLAAVSGAAHYYDFAWDSVADMFDGYFRAHLARQLADNNFLWGANMALRRSAWQAIRGELCAEAGLHEDFDLAIHLQAAGFQVGYDQQLSAGVSARRVDSRFIDYVRYTLVSPQTYARHGLRSRRHMYPVLLACWVAYVPARFIYRGFDAGTGVFSWSKLLTISHSRVDPTTNII